MLSIISVLSVYFNSQPHKEADHYTNLSEESTVHFNSQPHKEADMCLFLCASVVDISTHSLTRRLTRLISWKFV